MKVEVIQKKINRLIEDNESKSKIISENHKKIEALKKQKREIEMSEFINVISKKGMSLNTLKSKIINNEIEISVKDREEEIIEE